MKNKKIVLNCGSGIKYSVLAVIRAFEEKMKKKFFISYKITNSDETETICSNIVFLRKLLKIDIEKKGINDLIKNYL